MVDSGQVLPFGSRQLHHNVKSQPLSGWDFFCPFSQYWPGFRPWPLEHAPPRVAVPGALSAVFLSLFSAALLSIQGPKSCVGAGFRAIGLLLRLLGSARPRQRKAQKNRLAAACLYSTNAVIWQQSPQSARPAGIPRIWCGPQISATHGNHSKESTCSLKMGLEQMVFRHGTRSRR